jgi:hypothetical protein
MRSLIAPPPYRFTQNGECADFRVTQLVDGNKVIHGMLAKTFLQ